MMFVRALKRSHFPAEDCETLQSDDSEESKKEFSFQSLRVITNFLAVEKEKVRKASIRQEVFLFTESFQCFIAFELLYKLSCATREASAMRSRRRERFHYLYL